MNVHVIALKWIWACCPAFAVISGWVFMLSCDSSLQWLQCHCPWLACCPSMGVQGCNCCSQGTGLLWMERLWWCFSSRNDSKHVGIDCFEDRALQMSSCSLITALKHLLPSHGGGEGSQVYSGISPRTTLPPSCFSSSSAPQSVHCTEKPWGNSMLRSAAGTELTAQLLNPKDIILERPSLVLW